MGSTIFEISLIIFCTKFTLRHYQLLTKKRLYQWLHQKKHTHYEALGCGPIMACEVICLWTKCRFIMCHICWLVYICEGKYFASRRCLHIWADYEGRCCAKSPHFQMPRLGGYGGCILNNVLCINFGCVYFATTLFRPFFPFLFLDWIESWLMFCYIYNPGLLCLKAS